MARKTTSSRKLTAETLIALGPERLAQLVLTQAEADPLFARAVRMALAAKDDVSSLAHEIDKRLKTIRRSTSFLDWDKVRPLARELDQLRENIVGPLAEQSPKLAIEQMRLFLSLAESVYERADDSGGSLGDVFRHGGEDLGALWVRAGDQDPASLAAEILSLIETDGYGVFDGLPEAASPALGVEGRAAMRRLILERQEALSGDQRRRYDYKANWLLPKLKGLPAFEDFEAEQAALDFVVAHADAALALDFLIAWPDLKRAARLVLQRLEQLEGRRYDVLRPAAAALAADHSGAAALLYRRLVAGVVDRAASKYYSYAARDYHAAAALADAIESDAAVPSHTEWTAELRRQHGRKIGFWSLVDSKISR